MVTYDVMVPILFERGVQMLVAVYGILIAGGAYVPLEPHYPRARIVGIMEQVRSNAFTNYRSSAATSKPLSSKRTERHTHTMQHTHTHTHTMQNCGIRTRGLIFYNMDCIDIRVFVVAVIDQGLGSDS
eukprot:6472953-Amphidinium_carterae.1